MNKGVIGIDISGISTKASIEPHLDVLKLARKAGLFISAHVGESFDETDQMLILNELEPHRIGHGVCLIPEAVTWVKEHKTPVEVCLTSARLTKMHDESSIHPWILAHKDEGHPIVVCTDDPTAFGVNLSDEYHRLCDVLHIDQILALAKMSLNFACKKDADHFLEPQ